MLAWSAASLLSRVVRHFMLAQWKVYWQLIALLGPTSACRIIGVHPAMKS